MKTGILIRVFHHPGENTVSIPDYPFLRTSLNADESELDRKPVNGIGSACSCFGQMRLNHLDFQTPISAET